MCKNHSDTLFYIFHAFLIGIQSVVSKFDALYSLNGHNKRPRLVKKKLENTTECHVYNFRKKINNSTISKEV
jgi:hypothetical protein